MTTASLLEVWRATSPGAQALGPFISPERLVSVLTNGRWSFLHVGNVANNAYYNHRILEVADMTISSRVVDWNTHAISAPAWEDVDFRVPHADFVSNPNWSDIREAMGANGVIEPIAKASIRQPDERRTKRLPGRFVAKSKSLLTLVLARIASSLLRLQRSDLVNRALIRILNRITPELESSSDVCVYYGPAPLVVKASRPRVVVALEHGTVRWIGNGSQSERARRYQYRSFLKSADHLWVTNLDAQSIDIAESVAPGRWSALPHPYVLSEAPPLACDASAATKISDITRSEFLIFLPASMNWLHDHDKGSDIALEAFINLRQVGKPVGLVAVNWGRNVREAREMLSRAGVAQYVHWIEPLPRMPMQRLMASVHLVWDQFRIPAIGGVAFKAMEQGTPLVSMPLELTAVSLMGSRPPYLEACDALELSKVTIDFLADFEESGGASTRMKFGLPLRRWMYRRHHQTLTRSLQMKRYAELLARSEAPTPAVPHAWALHPDNEDVPADLQPSESKK